MLEITVAMFSLQEDIMLYPQNRFRPMLLEDKLQRSHQKPRGSDFRFQIFFLSNISIAYASHAIVKVMQIFQNIQIITKKKRI